MTVARRDLHHPVGRRLALGSLAMLGLAACTPAVSPSGKPIGGNALAEALEADRRFSTFVWLIQEQGIWQTLRDTKTQYTIFAPTDGAFDKLPSGWKADTFPSTAGPNGGYDNRSRMIGLLHRHFVAGNFPPSAFAGKTQPVLTLAGTQFIADGTQPGRLVLALQPDVETGIGFPVPKTTRKTINVVLPPIETAGGVIYPVDSVLVANWPTSLAPFLSRP
jgi:uncharacterized surface protein with fasciclin (FAS1) repeats